MSSDQRLGVMGFPMAINLREKMGPNATLLICDVSADAIGKFQSQTKDQGPVQVVKNGFEAVQKADIVVTMLPNGSAVESVYLDAETGILSGIRHRNPEATKELIIMECGTIESATIQKVAQATESLSKDFPAVKFVDAPVSGGPMGAQAGTLTFMVGGEETSFKAAGKILQHMGNPDGIFHCGDVGAGTAFKVINNYLSAITSLAASEALNIGAKMNLDLQTLTDVINVSGGQCWVTSKSNPVPGIHANAPASRGYEGGFRIELCSKVLQMGSDLAKMVGARTILDKPTLNAFHEACEDPRYKGKDARVVYKWLNEQS
ncbi:hypothetical protein N7510_009651 [Penicillium lagena]|uniref:uncharacterized protein n=1 Tax=Penicillium lagena TaxID=94218 RepID=UPI0025409FA6|nr:uncharacterized protein N7510_009651 [Penicillium lagena]KAJ5604497.1 hypothetical protein N7510_009651 [Penicillium lagena]